MVLLNSRNLLQTLKVPDLGPITVDTFNALQVGYLQFIANSNSVEFPGKSLRNHSFCEK